VCYERAARIMEPFRDFDVDEMEPDMLLEERGTGDIHVIDVVYPQNVVLRKKNGSFEMWIKGECPKYFRLARPVTLLTSRRAMRRLKA
jgi:hypothetical protein